MEELNKIKEILPKMTSADLELLISISARYLRKQVLLETQNMFIAISKYKKLKIKK